MSKTAMNRVDVGQGQPAIIFIHGFTCNLSHWKEQIPVFSKRHRCIAFDLPGHGESPDSPEASVEALARAVNEELDELGLNDVVLIGHSMGCRIASATFSQSPGRVRGIVYVDGSILASGDAEAAAKQATGNIERAGMQGFVKQLYDGFFVDASPAAAREFIDSGLSSVRLEFAKKLWPNLVRWDAARSRAVLATIDVPVLVIQSTSMDAALQRVSLRTGQTTPWTEAVSNVASDTTVTIVQDVGHFPMIEAPQQTNDAIAAFLQRLTPRAGGSHTSR